MSPRRAEGAGLLEEGLATYRRELLRWNRTFNLVSRVATAARVDALVTESRIALRSLEVSDLLPAPAAREPLVFADVGSGAGFPGLVWALEMAVEGRPFRAALVEPRERRAWFLARMVRILDLGSASVVTNRWGAAPARSRLSRLVLAANHEGRRSAHPLPVLVTLKALRLNDAELLAGLPSRLSVPSREVALVRFLPGLSSPAVRSEVPVDAGAKNEGKALVWQRGKIIALADEAGGEGAASLTIARYTCVEAG